ncbi:unnamed protein product [Nezara viridula]|uniref:Uncharacterized protein n=1 Tax=Nezara viridula TaxID=85310 RepID=A0A9P0HA24_NEZVI|nr:unnamed protein product [Nezara viridula]
MKSIMLLLLSVLSWISFTSQVLVENLDDEIDYYIDNLINPGGTLKVKPIIRTDNSVLMIKDNHMLFNASVGLQGLEIAYSVNITYNVITLHYNLEVSFTGISQEADFLVTHQDGQSCSATVTNARIQFGNIHVKLRGFSSEFFNFLLKIILERDDFKSKITDFVNDKTDLYLIHLNKHLIFNCYKMFISS